MSSSDDEVSSEGKYTASVDMVTRRDIETHGPKATQEGEVACVTRNNVAPESKLPPLIRDIRPTDILLGRGALSIRNPGNVNFGHIVALRKGEYKTTSNRHTKDTIAKQVMQAVRNSQGRFLRKVEESDEMTLYGLGAVENAWLEVEDSMATLKVKQSLRDKDSIRMTESLRRKYGQMDNSEGVDDAEKKPKRAKKKRHQDCEPKSSSPPQERSIDSTPSLGQHVKPHSVPPSVLAMPLITTSPARNGPNGTTVPPSQIDGSSSRSSATMVSSASNAAARVTIVPPSRTSDTSVVGDAASTTHILAAARAALEESNRLDASGQQQQDRAGMPFAQGINVGNDRSNPNVDALQALLQLRLANSTFTLSGQNQNQGMHFGDSIANANASLAAATARDQALLQRGLGNGFTSNLYNAGIHDWSLGSAPSFQYLLDMAQRNQLQEQLQRQQLQLQLESALYSSEQPWQLGPFDTALLSLLQGGSGTTSMPPVVPHHSLYTGHPNNSTFRVGVPVYNNTTANNPRVEEILRQHLSLSLPSGNTNASASSAAGSGLSNLPGFPV